MLTDCPKLVTGSEMAQIDQRSIEEHGVPGHQLMARAGQRVVEVIRDRWPEIETLSVAVICGKGNNGGDGYVIARLLHQLGARVRVLTEGEPEQASGDAAHHLDLLQKGGCVPTRFPAQDGATQLGEVDVIVDSLLGTGMRGAARPPAAHIIEQMNLAARPVVAVDLPSGLEADTGRVHGACVRAAVTVTFGLAKVGHHFHPGRSHCGDLAVVDIGFPAEAIRACSARRFLLAEEVVAGMIPQRPPDSHKGSCGAVAILAGSVGMTGAASLTAESALVAGAGRVTLGLPRSLNDILEAKLTEVMTLPLPEVRKSRCLSLRALGDVRRLLAQSDCLAIGPGLGTHRETIALVRRVVSTALVPMVIDADGLNAIAGSADTIREACSPLVLTPHPGEFERLTSLGMEAIREAPMEHARDFATSFGVTLVLKGAPTVVADAGGRVFVNPTGNAGMATAGAGDVLTGLITGLLAQGLEPLAAACAGTYLHGRAGDLARDRLGQWGMVAGDIRRAIPRALLETQGRCGA